MNFSVRTKLALVASAKELMKTTPLDKISVTHIVHHCGTTRQTFYRHFKDKYDLVNWYFDLIVQKTIRRMGVSLTLEEGLIKKFSYMLDDSAFFQSAFSSTDYNNLMHYDYECILEFYQTVARQNGEVDDEVIFLLEFYCHGSMDMTEEWILNGMKRTPKEMAKLLLDALPEKLIPYFITLKIF